ncbi:centrosomal protein kizuna isoform X1 [Eublepharis macularius]|uniref:Centrosomal protein kizuna n=1 Tax=Eublepharis macularius TaxID=481883 RepID=A0AA97JK04_EUBMA|nr:centrosomal protein kizuna isoform X1 [Eublepharis macularius]
MELERKMLEYSKPDVYLSKLKHMKLKKYLKEICERQKKSLLRNQDLLKEFDCIEAHIRKFASSSESLQKLKAEYERQIKSRLALQKNSLLKDDGKDNVKQLMMAEASQTGINTRTAMSRGLYHTATIFMGRQMSAVSSAEDFSALQKSSQLTKSFSISNPHPYRQPSHNSSVTDSCVVQTNNDLQRSNQSDKTDGKAYLVADAEMPVIPSISSENRRACFVTVEHKANNCGSNLVESKMSPEVNSLLHGRLSPENRAAGFKSDSSCRSVKGALTDEHSGLNEQGSKRPILLAFQPEQAVSGNEHSREKCPGPAPLCGIHTWTVSLAGGCPSGFLIPAALVSHGTCNLVNTSTRHQALGESLQFASGTQEEEDESLDESSDLTVSLNEDDEEEESWKQQKNLWDIGSKAFLDIGDATHKKEASPKERHTCGRTSSTDASAGPPVRECLSFEGFSYVLQYIEEMTAKAASECLTLYKSKPVNSEELETLTSICNQTGSLEQEDLEGCEALVLHQLQRLLQSTVNRCLLPEEALNEKSGMLGEKQVRPELSSFFAMIWERLNEHVLFLKKHNVSLTQEVKDMLGTLLILERNKQDGLVTPLLKDNGPEEYEDESSVCSNVTSCSSQTNKIKIKREKLAQLLDSNGAREHEVTNWCEDESKEEGLVEKIPITGLNIDGRSLKEEKRNATSSEASFSSRERRSPLSRDENQKGVVTTIKSKAFWGDSDDSNSDIEAALRPQVHCSPEDDFNDFYD